MYGLLNICLTIGKADITIGKALQQALQIKTIDQSSITGSRNSEGRKG